MDFTGYSSSWFGFDQASMHFRIQEALANLCCTSLSYRSLIESNVQVNNQTYSTPNLVAKEQDEPMNLCVRDENSSERSQSSVDLPSGLSNAERLGHLAEPTHRFWAQTDWTEKLRLALSQSDSGLVETDTDSAPRTSPHTSHCAAPNLTSNGTLYTSTPLRRRPVLSSDILGSKQEQSNDSLEQKHQQLQPQQLQLHQHQSASAIARSNAIVRMPTRHAQNRERCTRRRRVGWRGVAMCAACGVVYSGMDQLNVHFAVAHPHLLDLEWKLAQYNSTRASKLLFQEQLNRLQSEILSDNASSHSPTSPQQTDAPFNPSMRTTDVLLTEKYDTDHDTKPRLLPESKPYGSNSSPNCSRMSPVKMGACRESGHATDVYNSGSVDPGRTPLSEVELSQLSLQPSTTHAQTTVDDKRVGNRSKCYPCPRCRYTAKWPTELQKHVMVHADSRPFVCCVCSTSYKWSWDLGRHFSNAHPGLLNPYKRLRAGRHGSNTVGTAIAPISGSLH